MSKQYVLAPYIKVFAMYETDDFRLKDEDTIIRGRFTRTKNAKGLFNGHEIGFFDGDDGNRYIVFTDHSVRTIDSI